MGSAAFVHGRYFVLTSDLCQLLLSCLDVERLQEAHGEPGWVS